MASFLRESIRRHSLASPIAVWGKLPAHGDFLRHNTNVAQAQDWQNWVNHVWTAHPIQRNTQHSEHAERNFNPKKRSTVDIAKVPVSFVMQPGVMPFAPKHCVQGVVIASSDLSGRQCPLVLFQIIAPYWLRRTWIQGQAVQGQGDILYWLSRITARVHAADQSWSKLVEAVDALWHLYQPQWRHWVGSTPPAPTNHKLRALVHQYCGHDTEDIANGLKGVQRMPWPKWPLQIVRPHKPSNAFWQQDMDGGYVNVSEELTKLWSGSA